MAALKKKEILRKGRGRHILALKNLDAVLETQPYLKAKQRRQVHECLEFIAREGANFDALTQERIRVQAAILQAQKWQHSGVRGAGAEVQALYNRQAFIESRLLAGMSGALGASSAPRAVRQQPAEPQAPKSQPSRDQQPALSGPQHVRVGHNA